MEADGVQPITFLDNENVLDFDELAQVVSQKWALPKIEKKPSSRGGRKLEDDFPLTAVSHGQGELSFVHGCGLMRVACMLDQRGRPQSEYFELPPLQSPLSITFVKNDGSFYTFKEAMTVYLTLHVL